MAPSELNAIARSIVADNRGILAADESTGTITKRFDSIYVESTEPNRRAYRNLLFTTEGMEQFIGGVILFDETIRQQADDGTPFPTLLAAKGVVPGIKVDMGAHPLAGAPGETITEGLDGLRKRLAEYYELGARFAKWRATLSVGERLPSRYCVRVNAQALARYAALCQEAGIVPIVEPEVLMDTDHSIDDCYHATARTLQALFSELGAQRVDLEGILLKPNMVIPGKGNADQASPERIAEATLHCFRRHVPASVPGIVFLSGGQSEVGRPSTSTRSTASMDDHGRSRSPTGGRCRLRLCRPGVVTRRASRPLRRRFFIVRAAMPRPPVGGTTRPLKPVREGGMR